MQGCSLQSKYVISIDCLQKRRNFFWPQKFSVFVLKRLQVCVFRPVPYQGHKYAALSPIYSTSRGGCKQTR